MGAYKNKMLEEMDDEDHTDEYGGPFPFDETDFEELMEDQLIEKQIDEELQTLLELEADLNGQQKVLYNSMKVEKKMAKDRISLIKSILGGHKDG
jgi:hypothetical protein